MTLDLHFRNSGTGGGSSSGDYVKDAFSDLSLNATNNTSLTSTALTNPLGEFFGNTDAPKYGHKTLWVKDAVLIEDRSKWLSNKPTYKLRFTEEFPGVVGYACGNVRLRQNMSGQGKLIELETPGDFIGITGVVKNVMWIMNPTSAAAGTATRVLDGVDGSAIDFSNVTIDEESIGQNKYNLYVHSTTNNSQDLHDYRIRAVEVATVRMAGFTVYSENATNNVQLNPGSTYVDKNKITTTGITNIALDTVNAHMGGKSIVYKTAQGTYGSTSLSLTDLPTIGVGTNGTNSITVTTGQGQSFLPGMGFIATSSGTSFHVGSIVSVSTDTLTTVANLNFGQSGPLWRAWYAGSTVAINASFMELAFSFDPAQANNPINTAGFGVSTAGDFMFSDPDKRYRIWGDQLAYGGNFGYNYVAPLGATSGFLQVDGQFQAAEVEWIGFGNSAVLHGTFAINGVPSWGQNQGFTSLLKQTVFTDAAPGWNSFVFTPGTSFLSCGITRINFYQSRAPMGPTLGRLIELTQAGATATRFSNAINATFSVIGTFQRFFADDLYAKGGWIRAATHTAAGGVALVGATTNSVLNFQFYGQNFGVIGTAGNSAAMSLDGLSITRVFNAPINVATLGFHTLQVTQVGGTTVIEAVDIFRPVSEIQSKQNFVPRPELTKIPQTFVQGNTPRGAVDGDIWAQVPLTAATRPLIWVKLFGLWHQLAVNLSTDDPQLETFYRFGGSSTGANAGIVADGEAFSMVAWNAITAPTIARGQAGAGNASFQGQLYQISGADTAGTGAATSISFNKFAWASITATTTVVDACGVISAFGGLYANRGSTTLNPAAGQQVCYKFNNNAWATLTVWNNQRTWSSNFFVNSLISGTGGIDGGSAPTNTHETRTQADTLSTATVVPATTDSRNGSNVTASLGLITQCAGAQTSNAAYAWSGSAWTAALTTTTTLYSVNGNGQGYFASRNIAFKNGGATAIGSGTVATSETFNGVAYAVAVSSATARSIGASGVA